MDRLDEETFYEQFNNKRKVQRPHRRRKTYLCYQLEWPDGSVPPIKGCLRNKRGCHAEIRFIDEICSMELDRAKVTCYITWSPCRDCAFQLAALKENHPGLHLCIFASRLYYHWRRPYQEGLQHLWKSRVLLGVMDRQEFTDCWGDFVNDQVTFEGWDRLTETSLSIKRRLRRILESWGLNDLTDAFGNLQLGPE